MVTKAGVAAEKCTEACNKPRDDSLRSAVEPEAVMLLDAFGLGERADGSRLRCLDEVPKP